MKRLITSLLAFSLLSGASNPAQALPGDMSAIHLHLMGNSGQCMNTRDQLVKAFNTSSNPYTYPRFQVYDRTTSEYAPDPNTKSVIFSIPDYKNLEEKSLDEISLTIFKACRDSVNVKEVIITDVRGGGGDTVYRTMPQGNSWGYFNPICGTGPLTGHPRSQYKAVMGWNEIACGGW